MHDELEKGRFYEKYNVSSSQNEKQNLIPLFAEPALGKHLSCPPVLLDAQVPQRLHLQLAPSPLGQLLDGLPLGSELRAVRGD